MLSMQLRDVDQGIEKVHGSPCTSTQDDQHLQLGVQYGILLYNR